MLDFAPSKEDSELWMKDCGTHYEYIARYVDDVIAFSQDPMSIMKQLEETYVMKGVCIPDYYLGGDIVELEDQWKEQRIYTAFSAHTYIENSAKCLSTMCGVTDFKNYNTPMASDYHPEMDESRLCTPEELTKYRS